MNPGKVMRKKGRNVGYREGCDKSKEEEEEPNQMQRRKWNLNKEENTLDKLEKKRKKKTGEREV